MLYTSATLLDVMFLGARNMSPQYSRGHLVTCVYLRSSHFSPVSRLSATEAGLSQASKHGSSAVHFPH